MRKIASYNIKKQRNEYGRQIRKDIKELVPMFDGVCRTITTIVEDNLIIEVYADRDLTRAEEERL